MTCPNQKTLVVDRNKHDSKSFALGEKIKIAYSIVSPKVWAATLHTTVASDFLVQCCIRDLYKMYRFVGFFPSLYCNTRAVSQNLPTNAMRFVCIFAFTVLLCVFWEIQVCRLVFYFIYVILVVTPVAWLLVLYGLLYEPGKYNLI